MLISGVAGLAGVACAASLPNLRLIKEKSDMRGIIAAA
jgi:hypothetical protein